MGKSTRADVAAPPGSPDHGLRWRPGGGNLALYLGHHTAPTATVFVPVVKAVTPSLCETTREFAVTFSRDGTVNSLGLNEILKRRALSG